jgi:hypothetical protein
MDYLAKHIANVLDDDDPGKAVFSSNGENFAAAHCRIIIESLEILSEYEDVARSIHSRRRSEMR